MSALSKSNRSLVFLSVLAAGAIGCSAKASSPDGGAAGTADARRQTPRPDAEPFNFVDAMPQLDAAASCPDANEPNDTSTAATSLSATPVSDSDDAGGSFTGAAADADEDWFTYEGSDDLANQVDPTVGLTSGAVEICMFMDCKTGNTQYTCPGGTTDLDVGALGGCCGTTGFTVDNLNCTGTISDDANVYIRVKASAAGVCEAYSLTYHY